MINKKEKWLVKSAVCSVASLGWLLVLRDMGFKIYGIDIQEYCRNLNILDGFSKVVAVTEENENVFINHISEIIKNINPLWIISGPENEVYILSKNESFFKINGVDLFHPPLRTVEIIKDKYLLYNLLTTEKTNYIKLPITFLLEDYIRDIDKRDKLTKTIIKPREGRGSANIIKCDYRDLKNLSRNNKNINDRFILQEFIEGEECSVDVLFSLDGKILNIIPRKRNYVDSGISIVTTTFWDEKLVGIIEEISFLLNFRFMNNFQFIKNSNGYFLIDINPRFGGASIISFHSKESFRKNLFYILMKQFDKTKRDVSPPKSIRMIRYYTEFYEEF